VGCRSLRTCADKCKGDASRFIAGFPLTDDNYAHSVALLQAHYGQHHKIIHAHNEALLSLQKPSNSVASLQAFYDTLEQHRRALVSLGRASYSYGPLLTTSVLNILPPEIIKHMARDHHDSEWIIEDVMSGLLKEIR